MLTNSVNILNIPKKDIFQLYLAQSDDKIW